MAEERDRGIPLKINVRKPPPPQPETLEAKIDPERKKLLDSLSMEEQIYIFRRLKATVRATLTKHNPPAQAHEEEQHSDLYKNADALLGQIMQRTFRPDEMFDLAEKYTTMGFTTPHPEELKELTPEEIAELGLEASPLVQKKPQDNPLGGLLTMKLLGIAETAINNLTSSPKVKDAVANFLNTLAEAGKEEKP